MADIKNAIVVAMSNNRVIGQNNRLPWKLPEDLKYFKNLTMGHPIVMGRKTYESIGRPLPGRTNIVVTTNHAWRRENIVVARSIEQALEYARMQSQKDKVEKVMIIGGENIYRQVLPLTNLLYLTEVDAEIEGDAYFPEFDRQNWREISRTKFTRDAANPHDYAFVALERKE